MKVCFFDESAPNPTSRLLNTQLPLEISIRIQWKTSQNKLKSPKIIIISLTPIPSRGQLCIYIYISNCPAGQPRHRAWKKEPLSRFLSKVFDRSGYSACEMCNRIL